jgi:hypothetical protein
VAKRRESLGDNKAAPPAREAFVPKPAPGRGLPKP